ncbi:4'-phosphopantetheinyl transferase family protein [Actinospica robiniae]|uniref:4'-phosphopantetheinyl transferase family protein n=1 Tax=Actinospica robiniae TaxID=304901 RepID=UPI000406ED97|nr:4'-phosphopantetheinyl transferase superfamily protein [Actinospica robiniae]
MESAQSATPTQPLRDDGAPALIATIVPEPAVAVDTRRDLGEEPLPGEVERVERAVPSRRAEFATGRACARRALARLDLPPRAIPAGPRGEPLWPAGIIGSITHCAGYRGAVLARTAQIATIGIDAEPNAELPDGLLKLISLPEERDRLERLAGIEPSVHWDRLLFCAKEAVYKAWYPLAERWLDFEDAAVTFEPEHGRFTARLGVPGPLFQGRELTGFTGRWLVREDLILTAIVLPR